MKPIFQHVAEANAVYQHLVARVAARHAIMEETMLRECKQR
jgi:hypothetical protein